MIGAKAHIAAPLPAATPEGASSKTRQAAGSAGGENLLAAVRKMSGRGLPFLTWSPTQTVAHKTCGQNSFRPEEVCFAPADVW